MSRVTMQDIAGELGLSRFTVARALNGGTGVSEETRKKVVSTAQRLGYLGPYSRRRLSHFRTRNVLFLVQHSRFTGDQYFWPRVVAGVEAGARARGLNTMLATIAEEQEKRGLLPSALLERTVDGVLAVGDFDPAFLNALRGQPLPVVAVVDADGFEYGFDAIWTADARGAALAVRHLAELGHRRIGFLGDLAFAASFRRRYDGFTRTMCALGLAEHAAVAITEPTERHYWVVPEIKSALIGLADLPTAFLCVNDSAALTLIAALEEIGCEVPRDVSVVGFDDIDLAATSRPPLTTIRVFKERTGERALELLVRRLENPDCPRETILLETELVVRGSSGPARAGQEALVVSGASIGQ